MIAARLVQTTADHWRRTQNDPPPVTNPTSLLSYTMVPIPTMTRQDPQRESQTFQKGHKIKNSPSTVRNFTVAEGWRGGMFGRDYNHGFIRKPSPSTVTSVPLVDSPRPQPDFEQLNPEDPNGEHLAIEEGRVGSVSDAPPINPPPNAASRPDSSQHSLSELVSGDTLIPPGPPRNSLRNTTTFPPIQNCESYEVGEESFQNPGAIFWEIGHTAFIGQIIAGVTEDEDGKRWITVLDRNVKLVRMVFTKWRDGIYPYSALSDAVGSCVVLLYPRVRSFGSQAMDEEDEPSASRFEFVIGPRSARMMRILPCEFYQLLHADKLYFALKDDPLTEFRCHECGTVVEQQEAIERLMGCRGCGVVFFCNDQCQDNNRARDDEDPDAHCDKPICDRLTAVQWFTRTDWRLMRWNMENEETREPLLVDARAGNDQVPTIQHFRIVHSMYSADDTFEHRCIDKFAKVVGFPSAVFS